MSSLFLTHPVTRCGIQETDGVLFLFGVTSCQATAVSAQGYGWAAAPAMYTREQMEAWKPVVEA
jgi:hypothetical protein